MRASRQPRRFHSAGLALGAGRVSDVEQAKKLATLILVMKLADITPYVSAARVNHQVFADLPNRSKTAPDFSVYEADDGTLRNSRRCLHRS